jgi:hypothetical protein
LGLVRLWSTDWSARNGNGQTASISIRRVPGYQVHPCVDPGSCRCLPKGVARLLRLLLHSSRPQELPDSRPSTPRRNHAAAAAIGPTGRKLVPPACGAHGLPGGQAVAATLRPLSRVEMWRGGVGRAYLFAGPFVSRCLTSQTMLRFHSPLVEPDERISRIRLSDKGSCLRPREVARAQVQPDESQLIVEELVGE